MRTEYKEGDLLTKEDTEEKKLRKFEFEGWIGEAISCPLHTSEECIHDAKEHYKSCHQPLDKVFGYNTTGILNRGNVESNMFFNYSKIDENKYGKYSKWKITMEELPNENN